jgi:prepilin-type N-terminal cleavage/methylation domain-containing protein
MIKTKLNKLGFTIIELMISTVVFSLVMLLCLTGMVQVSRAYYKGITLSRTQEAGRSVMTEISQVIQLSGSAVSFSAVLPTTDTGPSVPLGSTADGTGAFCAGNKKYSYVLDRKVTLNPDVNSKESRNALISEDWTCTDSITASNMNVALTGNQRALLSENMRLTKFSVSRVVADPAVETVNGNQLWRIEISIAYGDQDLFNVVTPSDINSDYFDDQNVERVICKSGTGNEFCSTVELSTMVSRRIG